jgi:ribosome-binding factor A
MKKVVKIDSVVQHLIASKTLSEVENSALRDEKVADQKFKHLLYIITDHSNRKDLKAFKIFIEILGDTGNTDVAQQILPIYKERVRSSHLIYNFRVRTDLIYT